MNDIIARLEDLHAQLLEDAHFHAERNNTESAAHARAKAAGVMLSIREARKLIPSPTLP